MKSSGKRASIAAVTLAALIAVLAIPAAHANVARVEFVVGKVFGVDDGGSQRRLVKGSSLSAGDTVRTERGRAQIRFTDGGYTSLQPNTEFRIDDYYYDEKEVEESVGFFSLLKGGLRTITGVVGKLRKKAYQLRTPVATVGIRGTEYLAELGNSLTVHVGDGEINVCNDAGCTHFGAHQTGYVAGYGSLAVLADHPPSLAPPQERQVYAYNGGYQSQFDAAAEFRAPDDIQSSTLADGAFYALAVSWGEADIMFPNVDLFGAGLLSPSGELTDASFNSSGGLSSYYANNLGVPISGSSGSASIVDVGINGPVGWGRWTMGSATVGQSGGGSVPVSLTGASSHHYAIGLPTAVMPTNPATYSLVGATSPTFASGTGSPGTLNSASMSADFGMGTMNLNMDMTVNGNNYLTTNQPMNIISGGPNFSGTSMLTTGSNCISFCNTSVEGFFAGNDGSHAGLAYKTDVGSVDYINGAAAFTKD